MVLAREYYRYELYGIFGIIGSHRANIIVTKNEVITSNGVHAVRWDLRTGTKKGYYMGNRHEICLIRQGFISNYIAVAYCNGSINFFRNNAEPSFNVNGHKSIITALNFNYNDSVLASGGQDTFIILWDIVGECGIIKLKGHKGAITQLRFSKNGNILFSSSKDCQIKVWDAVNYFCNYSIVADISEIWNFVYIENFNILVSFSNEILKLWKYNEGKLEEAGKLEIMSKGNGTSLNMDRDEKMLFVHSNGKMIEIFNILNETQFKKKKRKFKSNKCHEPLIFSRREPIMFPHKVCQFDIQTDSNLEIKLYVLSKSNYVSSVSFSKETCDFNHHFKLYGHRSEARRVKFYKNDIISMAQNSIKVWNKETLMYTKKVACKFATCFAILKGGNYVLVSTKLGLLEILNFATEECVYSSRCHNGPVSSIVSFGSSNFISFSHDKSVKCWELLISENDDITLNQIRTLELQKSIIFGNISKDKKYIAVALDDNNLKIFYTDSLKLYLTMYRHTLPINCVDFSFDSRILISASQDRRVNVWGMDFGDCRRSIVAHEDSVMVCRFVGKTTRFFSAGRDNIVKQWDADTFECIQIFKGHFGPVWSIDVDLSGKWVVSTSHDGSLHVWNETTEILSIKDEEEKKRNEDEEDEINKENFFDVPGESYETIFNIASRKSIETVRNAETLIDSLDIFIKNGIDAFKNEASIKQYGTDNIMDYIVTCFGNIKPAYMYESLLSIPFSPYGLLILELLPNLIKNCCDKELAIKGILFLIRMNQHEIVNKKSNIALIENAKLHITKILHTRWNSYSFNLRTIEMLKEAYQDRTNTICDIEVENVKLKRKKRKLLSIEKIDLTSVTEVEKKPQPRKIYLVTCIMLIVFLIAVSVQYSFLYVATSSNSTSIVLTYLKNFENMIENKYNLSCVLDSNTKLKNNKISLNDKYLTQMQENVVAIIIIILGLLILFDITNKKFFYMARLKIRFGHYFNTPNVKFSFCKNLNRSKIISIIPIIICIIVIIYTISINLILKKYYNFVSLVGYCVFLLLLFLKSHSRKDINIVTIFWGISLQFLIAIFLTKGNSFLQDIGDRLTLVIEFTKEGSRMVFGSYNEHYFAFLILPVIITFSAIFSICTYMNIIQYFVSKIASLMRNTMQISGEEATVAVANVFLGMTESPLIVNHSLAYLSLSQIHLIMTVGFSTIAGSIMIVYVSFGMSAAHLITASVTSIPASIIASKILYPDDKQTKSEIISKSCRKDSLQSRKKMEKPNGIFDAITIGAENALKMIFGIATALIAFISILALFNHLFLWTTKRIIGIQVKIETLFSYAFYPISLLMGIDIKDGLLAGRLIGLKIFLNEFIAFQKLGCAIQNPNISISPKSLNIMTYALCGFANLGSMGIFISALSSLHPQRRKDFSKLALECMLAGNIACFMTACIAGYIDWTN
ncbi:hypothetical protein A3Q56_02096 [Intoshia linei]|uniref:Uncharacterized protein n=1 Tax=Intoshia linei TaxID=1819745 RepID=A0A177B781_9BILA|nr:hypothetical protein A3Q56_02096 [Intoshia linei]